ncbi:hypothetical protein [Brevibacillus panacihumi]|uniref:PepSY domain-containing protein n=1 Tax=Brevibacillus panacihumi TaxID=497735 RepID=A0A3M8CIP6_9BACL|nr:hypothetical protein [Brevibacillus panacihumi]RNB75646.1 hypothetical protein EDM58_18375 [Brevibacillus panacihumi]
MSWLSEEELLKQLKRLEKREPSSSFVDNLEERLVAKGKRLMIQRGRGRWSIQIASAAVIILLTVGLLRIEGSGSELKPYQENPSSAASPNELTSPSAIPKREDSAEEIQQTVPRQAETVQRQAPVKAPVIRKPAGGVAPVAEEAVQAVQTVQAEQAVQAKHPDQTKKGNSDRAALEKLATARFEQLVGKDEMHKYKINEILSTHHSQTASIVFTRIVNGIPYLDESYQVGVSVKQGVTGIQIKADLENKADTAVFPDVQGILSMEQAKQVFARQLRLVYVPNQVTKRDYFGKALEAKPTLQYVIPGTFAMDAKTGDVVNPIRNTSDQGEGGADKGTYIDMQAPTSPDLDGVPDVSEAVAPALAAEKFLEDSPLQLAYVWSTQLDQPVLVYNRAQKNAGGRYFDAITGRFVDISP